MKLEIEETYDIIHKGRLLKPRLNRDEYYQEKWVSVESTLEGLKEILNNVDPEARGVTQGISLLMGIQRMQRELRRT